VSAPTLSSKLSRVFQEARKAKFREPLCLRGDRARNYQGVEIALGPVGRKAIRRSSGSSPRREGRPVRLRQYRREFPLLWLATPYCYSGAFGQPQVCVGLLKDPVSCPSFTGPDRVVTQRLDSSIFGRLVHGTELQTPASELCRRSGAGGARTVVLGTGDYTRWSLSSRFDPRPRRRVLGSETAGCAVAAGIISAPRHEHPRDAD
jgi:hypothetical protein